MPPYVTVKLLIVDDHPSFRQGVRAALTAEHEVYVVGEAASAEAALEWLGSITSSQEPNVVLVDLNLPNMSGLDLTRHLRRQYPYMGVVMLSIHESDEQTFNALQAGAGASYRVDRAKEIDPAWLDGATTVGVTSGASVPEILVDDVLAYLAERGVGEVEEVRTATEDLMFSLPRELKKAAPR